MTMVALKRLCSRISALPLYLLLASCCYAGNADSNASSTEKRQITLDLGTRLATSLCKNDGYLTCMGISREECKIDISNIIPVCADKFSEKMPNPESAASFKEFGNALGTCIMERHAENRKRNRVILDKCLN